MNGMDYFLKFWRSQEDSTAESESLRKRLEDSEVALALLQTQKERELALSGERIAALEAKLAEDNSTTHARINDLEVKLVVTNVTSEKAIKDHSDIQKELSSMRIKAELELKA